VNIRGELQCNFISRFLVKQLTDDPSTPSHPRTFMRG